MRARARATKTMKANPGETMANGVPGPLLRRAVTATVKEAVDEELSRQKNNTSRSVKLIEGYREAYGGAYDVLTESEERKAAARTTARGPPTSSRTKSAPNTVAVSVTSVNSRTVAQKGSGSGGSPGKAKAASADWLTVAAHAHNVPTDSRKMVLNYGPGSSGDSSPAAVPPGKFKTDSEAINRLAAAFVKVELGETLLVDIPRGLDDTVESLLHAAALRCYVPEFFVGAYVSTELVLN